MRTCEITGYGNCKACMIEFCDQRETEESECYDCSLEETCVLEATTEGGTL